MTNFNANKGTTGDQATASWRPIMTYACPSAPVSPVDTISDSPTHWGITMYLANAGTRNYRRATQTHDGAFDHCKAHKIGDLTDGTSNTIFIGERNFVDPNFKALGDDLQFWGWWGFGAEGDVLGSAAVPINWMMPPNSPTPGPAEQANYDLRINAFGSSHTGGANFCMGDGSVRFIGDNLDLVTLQRLCTPQDGNVVNLP